MVHQGRASLGRVLDNLGSTLLEVACGDADVVEQIRNVVIHDPLDDSPLPRQALVLGVGLQRPAEIAALVTELGDQGAAGLVVRSPVVVEDTVRAAVAATGVPVLGLTSRASWSQLTALLRAQIAEGDVGVSHAETLGGMPSGDLFALANAISTLLDAPITIEDRSSRVLAFSEGQDESDPVRVETILGRQVPDRFARLLEERGVFREIQRSRTPVPIDPMPYDDGQETAPQLALAVRAGDEVLGSIWATVTKPLSAKSTQELQEAAKLVALHLLRLRAGADVERRLQADLVATALEGGPGGLEAVDRLGLLHRDYLVLALAADRPQEGTDAGGSSAAAAGGRAQRAAEHQRITDAFAMHLSAVYPRSAAAQLNDVAYAIVNVRGDRGSAEHRAAQVVGEFLDRIGHDTPLLVGIGTLALTRSDLTRSRAAADRALRVLRSGRTDRRFAAIDQVHVEALMLELADLSADRDEPAGPLARLLDHDARKGANLVETLDTWLDSFGDVTAASAATFTHANTFRYRLRKVAEVGQVDLDDPETRFALMLQLRLLRQQILPAD
ncbi:helix-turn-helix domain-containing protein [Nocardioides sp. QY071]|uniref:PucR family transcriptional regulator n=1 Tax=Nocardioides sp. QY071 TaxID=3044187 RepID=UPI00249C705A|nr:helix-turn-helix domain-containing protein [Nocardioides sp. QY071]WGY00417.1 helix-turn-helix domain-containing protein [Nocardioides sp. QY071]